MKRFVVDPSLCIYCANCQNACKDEHCGVDRLPVAASQGEGQFWIRIDEREVCSADKVRLQRTPVICQHCENPACAEACPHGAVSKRSDGLVIIDSAACQGCGACREACPYSVIYENTALGISQKCTGCAHLLDAGWERPRCVNACPTDALRWVDDDELTDENLYAPLEVLHPEYGTEPNVAYVRLHKPFLCGNVFDPRANISLDEVSVTVTGPVTGVKVTTTSNNYGDFSAENLAPGFYDVTFVREGYYPKTVRGCDVREAVNVGDIALAAKLA